MNWDFVSFLLQSIQTIAVVVALIYGWKQLKDTRRDYHMGVMWQIFADLSTLESQAARKFVYRNRQLYLALKEGAELASLDDNARLNAHIVASSLDRIAYAVHKGLVPKNLLLDGYHYIIARCWIALEPYIDSCRIARRQPSHHRYFELIAEDVFAKYVPRDKVTFSD